MSETRQVLNKASMGIGEGLPLEASQGGIEELRKDIQRLMDMEAIKQLKHAYFRCIDTANMEELATLYQNDVEVDCKGGDYVLNLNGKQQNLATNGTSFSKQAICQPHRHNP